MFEASVSIDCNCSAGCTAVALADFRVFETKLALRARARVANAWQRRRITPPSGQPFGHSLVYGATQPGQGPGQPNVFGLLVVFHARSRSPANTD